MKKRVYCYDNLNERRSVLLLSLCMLIASVLLLTSATYAWLLTTDTGTVGNMRIVADIDATVSFSFDCNEWTTSAFDTLTYEQLVKASENSSNRLPADKVSPMSSAGKLVAVNDSWQFGIYDARVYSDSLGYIHDIDSILLNEPAEYTNNGNCYAFDLYAKSETTEILSLKEGSEVLASQTDGYNVGFNLSNAVRVAFVNYGTVTISDVSGAKEIECSENSQIAIWEPNALEHNSDSGVADGVYNTIYAIAQQQNLIDIHNFDSPYMLQMQPNDANCAVVYTDREVSTSVPLFTINAGITKMRVYVWIEGQDVDCTAFSSGMKFLVNLSLGIDSVTSDEILAGVDHETVRLSTVSGCEDYGAPTESRLLLKNNVELSQLNASYTRCVAGYVFEGWYLDKAGTIPATGTVSPLTLYAKFVAG